MVREFVNQTDKRVIKTKKAIINAFTKLLTKYDGSEITITSVAKNAGVNRKTIYNYYNNVTEIFEEIENKCVSDYENAVANIPPATNYRDIFLIFNKMTDMILADVDFYVNLIHIKNNSKIIFKTYNSVTTRVRRDLRSIGNIDEDKIDFVAKFVSSSMISAYINWLRSDKGVELQQIVDDTALLVLNGMSAFKIYNYQ